MTTFSGDDDGFDWAALEAQFNEKDVVDVTSLDNMALLNLFRECGTELQTLREEMVPRTDRGREVHSLRAAARVELARRRLL